MIYALNESCLDDKKNILGNLYHHGHLSRAVCCRLVGEPDLNELLPEGYRLNHPDLGRVIVCTPSRETEKTKPHSINWCLEDERPELTSGVNGTSDERLGFNLYLLNLMFVSFLKVAKCI